MQKASTGSHRRWGVWGDLLASTLNPCSAALGSRGSIHELNAAANSTGGAHRREGFGAGLSLSNAGPLVQGDDRDRGGLHVGIVRHDSVSV